VHHHHRYCFSQVASLLPKRVLELTDDWFFLRENLNIRSTYACLSHCWGPNGLTFKLTKSTLGAFKDGTAISKLPRTFMEAAQLCLRLGIRYIWIDALCMCSYPSEATLTAKTLLGILQGDEDDWKEAAATMGSIYENSFLTIAATRSNDSTGGLFSKTKGLAKTKNAKKLKTSVLHLCEERFQDFQRFNNSHVPEFGNWPLLQRAWFFQERRLSPRIIHFTDNQLVWECQSVHKSETGDIDENWTTDGYKPRVIYGRSVPSYRYPVKNAVAAWQRTVVLYSRLDLTFSKDRLPAIAAIVERMMCTRKDDVYIAGMWKSSLLRDLAWYPSHQNHIQGPTDPAPTWSWASAPGAVQFLDVTILPAARLIDVTFTPVGPPHMGDVTDSSITLKEPSGTASRRRSVTSDMESWKVLPDISNRYKKLGLPEWNFIYDYNLTSRPMSIQRKDSLRFLLLWYVVEDKSWLALALRQVSETHFERIGMCTMRLDKRHHPKTLKNRLERALCRNFIASLPVR
jgi:hypothetical protein